jgi:hypothetical protein
MPSQNRRLGSSPRSHSVRAKIADAGAAAAAAKLFHNHNRAAILVRAAVLRVTPPATAQYSCIGRDNPPETGYDSSALFIMPYSPLTAASTLALNSITSVTHCYM